MASLSDLLLGSFNSSYNQGADAENKRRQLDQQADLGKQAASAKALEEMLRVKQTGKQNIERDAAAHQSSLHTAGQMMGFDESTPEGMKSIGDAFAKNGGALSKDSVKMGPDQTNKVEIQDSHFKSRQDHKIMKDLGDRTSKLNGEYDGSLDVMDTLKDIASNPNGVNKGHIKTLLARIEAGKFKPFQQTLNYAGGDKTYAQAIGDQIARITGDDSTVIPTNQLRDIISTTQQHLTPLIGTYNQRAKDLSGYGASQGGDLDPGAMDNIINTPVKARQDRLKSVNDSLSSYLKNNPAKSTNFISKTLAGMFGHKSAAPAAVAPKTRTQNGITYTLNPSTGEWE